ncbi:nucleotidyltransferase domain-containing protein [Chamaesiphon polymorphus]|uniref:Nucleotidyltransferase family protein n=1 Tax=Chamaesiphon polymorphus CCALA 037 TaxID=2107692 RepID=A0A2T1GD98_9CYAN|nr:nucleotidyltransferase family protein [Chamaesiphon polymorphus]PSB55396.1 hypothetical protein C7B77_15145 [Chamaesiphon polymorphus CCALA 037]
MTLAATPILTLTDLDSPQRLEVELLLCCSHTHPSPEQVSRIQELVERPLDWNYIYDRANHHHILPLLDRQLQNSKPDAIPIEILERIRTNFNENFQRNLCLTAELIKLSQLFETQQVPMLTFKGPVLAQIAYGNLALRQFVDIDILVAEADVIGASKLLIDRGYEPQFKLTDRQLAISATLQNEQWFWHEGKQICVDLHWSILPKHYSFTPDPQTLWNKIDRVQFGDREIETLTPEHLLLFLCAHGAKHNWWRLYWICDIAELLRTHPDLDWEYIDRVSGRFGTRRMLLLGLYLANKLLDVPLPEAQLTQLASDPQLPLLFTEIQDRLFPVPNTDGKAIAADDSGWTWRDYGIYRSTITSLGDRVWYWVDAISTPTPLEWQIVTLSPPLFPLYYLIRIVRLSLKYIFRIGDV